MPEKIGVYIDESNIGSLLSAEKLAEFVTNTMAGTCPVVKVHPRLNTEDGRALIQADIDAGAIDSVCICGSSPRYDWDIFNFGDAILVDRVNLREQVALGYQNPDGTRPAEGDECPEELMIIAQDYIKMGVMKLSKMGFPTPEVQETYKTIMVLGGGWTGLTAAMNAAQTGFDVVIVEKEAELGGYAKKLYKTIPLGYPYTETQDTGIDQLISAVNAHDKIKVVTGTKIKTMSGAPGQFEIALENGEELKIGAMVLATGWVPQDPKYLEPLGYGRIKNVVTSMEFEEMAKSGKLETPAGQPAKTVCFLLGTGELLEGIAAEEEAAKSAEPEEEEEKKADDEEGQEEIVYEDKESWKHLPYSSEVSSLTALKQAGYVTEFHADGRAFVIYEHMMVPGINEHYYKAAQDKAGVMLSKGQIVSVTESGDKVIVTAKNTLLGELIELEVDMVVLPTGIVPVTAHEPTLELQYRQGPAFPDLELFDGFADSNYICFPYETRRTGIYAAGCIRQPMTMSTASEDAAGAALKAIQCMTSANFGVSVHPRSGDKSFPVFNFVRCTQCKRCTEECPFGALDDDPKGTPMPNPTRCRRCGTCMGACPERVISFDNYNIDMIGSMIKQVGVPPKIDEGGPRAIVLVCENDAYPALDMAAAQGKSWSPYVRFIPVRCLGSVNTIWIADAMSKGIDGVMLLGCKYGDNYQCHFVKGSELCNRRMENVAESLKRLGVEPERVVQEQVAIDEYELIPEKIDTFLDYILKIGPNPFKGY